MAVSDKPAVYFDIGDTMGAAQVTPPPPRLASLLVFPHVVPVLQALRSRQVRLGIISNTGRETADDMKRVLQVAGLFDFFDADRLIYSSVVGLQKDSPQVFKLAIDRAGMTGTPDQCVFVGEDSQERAFAMQAGMRVCPHPLLVESVLAGDQLYYVALDVPAEHSARPWRRELSQLAVVPLSGGGFAGRTLYAIAAGSALSALANSLFDLQVLGRGDLPLETDLFLLRDDVARESGFMSATGQAGRILKTVNMAESLLASSENGLVTAVPAGRSVEEIHFEGARHGHHFKFIAAPSLAEPFSADAGGRPAAWLESAAQMAEAPPQLNPGELDVLVNLDAQAIERHLNRYAGVSALGDDGGEKVRSRHVHAADNSRVTAQLARDLEKIGAGTFQVRLLPFSHELRTLMNVEAELPAASDGIAELVLITAHLDSTAAFSPPFDSIRDPAPGADDDGSGVAAVLSIAERLKALANQQAPRRAIRFVLFNAEEHGLVGSQAYARAQAAVGAPIVAVYQMDMIGFNQADPRSCEVHAGFWPSADTQRRSLALAQRMVDIVPIVSPLLELPQVYRSTGASPLQRDPAEGRSDHAAFQQHGYAACVVSEDFFVGPTADAPAPDNNPNYHMKTDTFVDAAYAADIARAVAAAAWTIANNR